MTARIAPLQSCAARLGWICSWMKESLTMIWGEERVQIRQAHAAIDGIDREG